MLGLFREYEFWEYLKMIPFLSFAGCRRRFLFDFLSEQLVGLLEVKFMEMPKTRTPWNFKLSIYSTLEVQQLINYS